MMKQLLAIAALSSLAISAHAVNASQVDKTIELKDGSTVYIFKDGKMGMEDELGRATYMAPGHAMETKDGKKIVMNGNEIWRLDELLHRDHRN